MGLVFYAPLRFFCLKVQMNRPTIDSEACYNKDSHNYVMNDSDWGGTTFIEYFDDDGLRCNFYSGSDDKQ